MKNKKEKIILLSLIAITIIGIIVGISYAYIMYSAMQQSTNTIDTDCIKIELVDETDAIKLEKAYPMSDAKGANTKPYRFTISNVCNVSVDYSVNLDVLGIENRMESKNISTKIDENGIQKLTTFTPKTPTYVGDDYTAVESYSLTTGSLKVGESITHSLRLWLNADAGNETQNKSFYSKVVIEAVQNNMANYTEDILNGADPVLADNLIPVTIADDGTVKKADVFDEWYNYGNKVWANAVILSDKSVSYADNETIPESNIESYFVWIPKYSYQIWDLGTYTGLTSLTTKNQPINIKFGITNTSDSVSGECTTPGTSGGSGNCSVNDYMTPPAFTTMGTNGIWVGKFETGYKGSGSTSAAQVNSSDSTKVQIKPNVYSWRNITVGNIFTTVYNYQRDMDSHMMKNTEWAVAAMLSHTQYGKGTEVWINNNSNFVTGCVGASASASSVSACTNAYNTTNGYQGSTTGNISGIYDMSGGAWEYMAGYISGNTGSSGLNPSTYNAKYFDVYSSSSATNTYQYRILGDLTGELGPFATDGTYYRSSWYSDYAGFVQSSYPWFIRSGYYGNSAGDGAFYFYHDTGGAGTGGGFRVVLAV